MWSTELLHINLLTPILGQTALRLVLIQGLALRSAQRPTALLALDVILRLDAVQTAQANGCGDLCWSPDQRRLLQDYLVWFNGAGGHQMPAQLLIVGDL